MIGYNILNSGVDFAIKLKMGAGAFVCGEETAFINIRSRGSAECPAEAAISRSSGIVRQADGYQRC